MVDFIVALRFLMPLACGKRMFAEQKDEDFSTHIQWVNSKIKDPNYHIESLTDLAQGTPLLQLVDSCIKNTYKSKHEFVFGELDDSRSLSLVKVKVAVTLMEAKGVIGTNEFSPELIAAGDLEQIRGVVVKLALFPTTLPRCKHTAHGATNEDCSDNVITEVW